MSARAARPTERTSTSVALPLAAWRLPVKTVSSETEGKSQSFTEGMDHIYTHHFMFVFLLNVVGLEY